MKKLELTLETLSCPSCVKRIEGTLNKTEGIKHPRVLFHSSKVKVQFDESIISAEDISTIVEKLGFPITHKKIA
ncbi:heavy-metal-associated domain-containing protein [Pseudogracilibacillus sp. ICA-222130]|uniref:heavy-metal-associated domain-containing protein n=1 Tax=Pseudogracilibacillus sp. ICA-222130 TaxID=3134655 RepID=UPI0030BE7FCF